ncbi:cell division protein ZapA [Lentibacillus amyloliquefaciens]|uniref:Cell division protein ZapA n=1 Tax=Lentibacillus amyloliquefaciens TaxID=1472767 RepID=A0A0U3NNC3_9BACI|nr:cell division protein ZapA [Lentibacillus amyloliquefaciens]ALX48251.1 cell division protein ZapA [Lentibacillus amyloliquefaciens]
MAEDDKTRVTVEIYNKHYTIVGKEDPNDVRLVAGQVDQKMREIHSANQQLTPTELAVLTAVNTMNDYMKLKKDYAELLGSQHKKEDK